MFPPIHAFASQPEWARFGNFSCLADKQQGIMNNYRVPLIK